MSRTTFQSKLSMSSIILFYFRISKLKKKEEFLMIDQNIFIVMPLKFILFQFFIFNLNYYTFLNILYRKL